MSVNSRALIGQIEQAHTRRVDAAAGLCLSRTNYDVEVEHYLMKLLETDDTDAEKILHHFGVNTSRVSADLARSLDRMKRGNGSRPSIGPAVWKMLTEAWTDRFHRFRRRSYPHRTYAGRAGVERRVAAQFQDVSKEFEKIQPEALRKEFASIVGGSAEDATDTQCRGRGSRRSPSRRSGKAAKPPISISSPSISPRTPSSGKIDPVLGRDFEIRQVIDILTRRRQNNPILTGEAGVGKTAVVEGFALRIAQGDVPPPLKNVAVRTLDLALLQAGAGIKGEFENRLRV